MECSQVVPLLSSSPDDLILEVGRRAAPMFDETDEFIDLEQDEDKTATVTNTWHPTRSDLHPTTQIAVSTL